VVSHRDPLPGIRRSLHATPPEPTGHREDGVGQSSHPGARPIARQARTARLLQPPGTAARRRIVERADQLGCRSPSRRLRAIDAVERKSLVGIRKRKRPAVATLQSHRVGQAQRVLRLTEQQRGRRVARAGCSDFADGRGDAAVRPAFKSVGWGCLDLCETARLSGADERRRPRAGRRPRTARRRSRASELQTPRAVRRPRSRAAARV